VKASTSSTTDRTDRTGSTDRQLVRPYGDTTGDGMV
jgi:hypothetical protein